MQTVRMVATYQEIQALITKDFTGTPEDCDRQVVAWVDEFTDLAGPTSPEGFISYSKLPYINDSYITMIVATLGVYGRISNLIKIYIQGE